MKQIAIFTIDELYKSRGPDKQKRKRRDSRFESRAWGGTSQDKRPIKTDWKSWTPGTKEYEESRKVEKSQVKGYTRTRKGKMERVSPYAKQFALKEKRVNRAIAKLDKPEKIKTIGSQRRESLATTDFELVGKKGKEVILRDKETGIHELWSRNDHFAGYTIGIGGKGYEFVSEVKDVSKLESMGVKVAKRKEGEDRKEKRWGDVELGEPFSTDKKGRAEKRDFEELLTDDEKDAYMMMREENGWSHDKAMRKLETDSAPDYEDLLYERARDKMIEKREDRLLGEPFSAIKKLSVPDRHQLKIAYDTLKMSDVGAHVMGGPTKKEAVEIIKKLTGKDLSSMLTEKGTIGEPFSATTKQMEHEVHRMSTMSDKALMTRANKITDTDKLVRFYAVAERLNRPELMSHIKNTGKDKFGLKDSDFEPMKDWEKKKSPKRITEIIKPKESEKKEEKVTSQVSPGKIMSFIHGNIEKIGYDKWNARPIEERHQLEIRWMKYQFDLEKLSPKELNKIALKLEDENYHGPANYLWKIAGMPYYDYNTKGMMQQGKSLQKGEVKPFSRTRRGRFERVKGHHREGQAGAKNYLIDIGSKLGEPYSTQGTQIQKIGGVDIKKIIQSTYPTYKGRKVSIGTNIPSELHSWWDEGHRSYYTFYELATGRMQATGSNHPMFEAKRPRYLSSLPGGVVIVARNYSGSKQSVSIYANESDLTATSHPAGALDQAIKNFTSSPTPIPQHIKPEQEIGSPYSVKETLQKDPIKSSFDKTERVRRQLVGELNSSVASDDPSQERKRLEAQYGKVWDTGEMTSEFEAVGFMAPFVVVKRRADGAKGSMMFQHNPRFYFNFTKEPGQVGEPYIPSLSIGAVLDNKAKALDLSDDSISQEKLGEHINNLIERAGKKRLIRPEVKKDVIPGLGPNPEKEVDAFFKESRDADTKDSMFSVKKPTGPRSVYQIAQEIAKDWKNVNYGAKPYLDAMHALETIDTPYGADSGSSIIAYFLANAQTWKGETAKRVKKELNAMLKNSYKKSMNMEDEVLDSLVKAESRVKSHVRNIKGKVVNVREHQRYKLKGMLNHVRYSKEAGESRGATLRGLQDRFGLSTEMAHRVHRLAEALGGSLFKPFPVK